MAESALDSCADCGHRDYQHHGACVGAGLHLGWSRFLLARCRCERFVSLQRQLQQARLEADSWEQGCSALRDQLRQAIKQAETAEALAVQAIRDFVERVNRRAETEMMETDTLEGAHHRAIEAELATIPAEAQAEVRR